MLEMSEVFPRHNNQMPVDCAEATKPVFYREVLRSGKRSGQVFTIALANDDIDRSCASEIINRQYGRRGYGSSHQLVALSECKTFTACCDGQMIGTLTLRVDSPMRLVADETFPGEMLSLRAGPGVSLCELTKFAFDPSSDSRPLLAKLFHVIFVYGTQRFACSDLVIEVNPRHVAFYESMLGFARVGTLNTNDAVSAPSQLMHLAVAQIGRNIARYAGGAGNPGRSLYPYFFGSDEEQELRLRIVTVSADSSLPTSRLHAEHATLRWIQQLHQNARRRKAA